MDFRALVKTFQVTEESVESMNERQRPASGPRHDEPDREWTCKSVKRSPMMMTDLS
jgi:hypothetical protein